MYIMELLTDNYLIICVIGGGWCFTEKDCLRRRDSDLGSSDKYPLGLYEKDLRYFYLRSNNNRERFVKRKQPRTIFGDWNLAFIK